MLRWKRRTRMEGKENREKNLSVCVMEKANEDVDVIG
jgi:hypothetical protein